jgi:hypothetical protein
MFDLQVIWIESGDGREDYLDFNQLWVQREQMRQKDCELRLMNRNVCVIWQQGKEKIQVGISPEFLNLGN